LRRALEAITERLDRKPSDVSQLLKLDEAIAFLPALVLEVNLWRVQNMYFKMAKTVYSGFCSKASAGDDDGIRWVESFQRIGRGLSFNTSTILAKDQPGE